MKHARIEGGAAAVIVEENVTFPDGSWTTRKMLDRMERQYKLERGVYEVVLVTNDTSTEPEKIREFTGFTVEADHVAENYTVRNKTAAEITAFKDASADEVSRELLGKLFLSVFRVMYGLAQQVNPTITPAQFKTFVDNETASTDITMAAFKQWVKEAS